MSPETPDGILLRLYVKRRSEAAFGLLVRRHLNLVYAVCLREVGDAEIAEDASLSVFLILARRAPALRGGTGLAGWLFQTARLAARNARRAEHRRRGREQEVAEIMQHGQEAADADIWEAAAPRLNDALASLGAADRECVLLRFFEGCSLTEVGARLGVTENTARMRVARAVEKMRRRLVSEGVILAAPALAVLLLERAAPSAPASCVTAAGHLLSQPGVVVPQSGLASVQAVQLAQGVLHIMAIKTATTVAVAAALALTAGGLALGRRHQEHAAQEQAMRQKQGPPAGVQRLNQQAQTEYERAMAQSRQQTAEAQQRLAGQSAAQKPGAIQMAYTQLPMAHGRDIRRPMRGLDEMYHYVETKETQELTEGEKLHRPRAKSMARFDAAYKAGTAEIKRVVDSGYAKPFDKNVVEQAIRDASH